MSTRRGPDESVRIAVSGDNEAGSKWTNVFWLHTTHTTPIDAATMNTLCGNFHDVFAEDFLPYMHHQAHLLDVSATYFPTGSPLVVVGNHTSTDVGGVSEDPLPASVAAVVSWQAGVYWRGGKPRTYIGALPVTVQDAPTQFTAGFIGDLAASGDAFIGHVNALTSGNFDSCQLGLVSFVSGGVDRTPPLFFPIVACAVHSRIDTQRRRLGKS